MRDVQVSRGPSLTYILGFVFVILKLTGVITWPWLWVLSPFWILIAFWLLVVVGMIYFITGRPGQ